MSLHPFVNRTSHCRFLAGLLSIVLPAIASPAIAGQSIMGMQLESLQREARRIVVVTTGAKFVLQDDGTLQCWQRIGVERLAATLHFSADQFPLAVIPEVTGKRTWAWMEDEGFTCRIFGQGASLRISGDSLVVISFDTDAPLRVEGHFAPAYHVSQEGMVSMSPALRRQAGQLEGKWLILDEQGGIGVFPVADKKVPTPNFEKTPWSIEYDVARGEEIWLGVCPPRSYNWKLSFEPLAHEGLRFTPAEAYASERIVRLNAVHNKVLAIHSYFWPGGERDPWFIRDFYPVDLGTFEGMRDRVHAHGMKLVVYFSPFYASVPDCSVRWMN